MQDRIWLPDQPKGHGRIGTGKTSEGFNRSLYILGTYIDLPQRLDRYSKQLRGVTISLAYADRATRQRIGNQRTSFTQTLFEDIRNRDNLRNALRAILEWQNELSILSRDLKYA